MIRYFRSVGKISKPPTKVRQPTPTSQSAFPVQLSAKGGLAFGWYVHQSQSPDHHRYGNNGGNSTNVSRLFYGRDVVVESGISRLAPFARYFALVAILLRPGNGRH